MNRKRDTLIICAAVAAMFKVGGAAAETPSGVIQTYPTIAPPVKCYGVNSCKGQGACGTSQNSCVGKNSCKGKGFLEISAKDCSAKHGQTKEPAKKKKT